MRYRDLMQPDLDCLLEAPYHASADVEFDKHEDKPTKLSKPQKDSKKIGSFGDYHIYQRDAKRKTGGAKARDYYAVHKKTGETHLSVFGYHHAETSPNHFKVSGLKGSASSGIKAHEFYHHLITKHGVEMHSDHIQTTGGMKVWQRLSKNKDVHMDHIDREGKKLKLARRNWSDNYGHEVFGPGKSSSHFVARKK